MPGGVKLMNAWVQEQIASFHRLQGQAVVQWIGIEMALRDAGADGLRQWEDESVPMLQLSRVDLLLKGGGIARIVTYQNDDRWGLSRRDELPPVSPRRPAPTSIFR